MRTLFLALALSVTAAAQSVSTGGSASAGGATWTTTGTAGGGGGVTTNENLYCPPGPAPELTEQTSPTWGTSDGIATLPTKCMNTAITSTPSLGTTISATDTAGLNTALGTVICGQTILLSAGVTYTGTFTLPAKGCSGSQWITIRSTGVTDPNFPPEGVRATPCIAGISNDSVNGYNEPGYPSYSCPAAVLATPLTAKIVTTGSNPAVQFADNADHYRLIGIEFAKTPGSRASQIVQTNIDKSTTGGANHVIFDRVLIHGEQWLPTCDLGCESQAGLATENTTWVALINSWDYDTYCVSSCADSQAYKAGTGAGQDGPHKIYNNLMASAGETWLFGGGGQGPGTPISMYIEMRANHATKPLPWMIKIESGSLTPFNPVVKNSGEFKNGIQALFEGNWCENSWLGQADQDGFCWVVGAKNQNSNDQVPIVATGTTVVTAGSCSASACTPNFNADMLNASGCAPGGCKLEINGFDYIFCNGSNGCDQDTPSHTNMWSGSACVTGPTPASCTTARIFVDPANPTATLPNGTIAYTSVFACHPGKCPTCKIQDVTIRYNEIYNVINGLQIATSVSSHCKDESAGNSRISMHDNKMDGLSIDMTSGSDPDSAATGIVIGNGQTQGVISFLDFVHNTVAIDADNVNGQGGLGVQRDGTDLQYLQGFNFRDNVSPEAYFISHSAGSTVQGLNTAFLTDSCQPYYPSDPLQAINGIIQADGIQSFTISPIPGGTNYIVTLNGLARTTTVQTATSFTITQATHAGDSISVRDKTQCNWTFLSNLLGTSTSMQGAGKSQAPYPDGTIIATANNSIKCGAGGLLTCLLDQSIASGFTSQFVNWNGRNGDYNLLPTSLYYQQASDAASRAATGKSPGADLTTLGTLLTNVAGSVFYPPLTITPFTISCTRAAVCNRFLSASFGASQYYDGYKSWFLPNNPTLCAGDCGVLPVTAGILIGRSGTVNGPFVIITVKRAVQSCGSAGTVACSTFTIKQTLIAGAPQIGQQVTLSQFANGSGSSANDSTFNGTCTITLTGNNTFSCAQTGTGADTIASHTPNSTWQGIWKNATTYVLNDQVLYNNLTYRSLINNNLHNQPDISPASWAAFTPPANQVTGALAGFFPFTAGNYVFWVGVRDGAFNLAYKQVNVVVP